METSGPGGIRPPKQKKRKKSHSASDHLPAGWDTVRSLTTGETLFLHQDSLQCQRERPGQPEPDQHRGERTEEDQQELSQAGAGEVTLERMACRFRGDNSVTEGEHSAG